MRSIYNRPDLRLSNEKIFRLIMRVKSEIDTIREEKSLDDSHDLSLASNHLNSFLDALESQIENEKGVSK